MAHLKRITKPGLANADQNLLLALKAELKQTILNLIPQTSTLLAYNNSNPES